MQRYAFDSMVEAIEGAATSSEPLPERLRKAILGNISRLSSSDFKESSNWHSIEGVLATSSKSDVTDLEAEEALKRIATVLFQASQDDPIV